MMCVGLDVVHILLIVHFCFNKAEMGYYSQQVMDNFIFWRKYAKINKFVRLQPVLVFVF